jgi:DNA topoisomerase-6 subunit B
VPVDELNATYVSMRARLLAEAEKAGAGKAGAGKAGAGKAGAGKTGAGKAGAGKAGAGKETPASAIKQANGRALPANGSSRTRPRSRQHA